MRVFKVEDWLFESGYDLLENNKRVGDASLLFLFRGLRELLRYVL